MVAAHPMDQQYGGVAVPPTFRAIVVQSDGIAIVERYVMPPCPACVVYAGQKPTDKRLPVAAA